MKCPAKTEVYARVCGFFRPVQQWNLGKKEEYRERKEFIVGPIHESDLRLRQYDKST